MLQIRSARSGNHFSDLTCFLFYLQASSLKVYEAVYVSLFDTAALQKPLPLILVKALLDIKQLADRFLTGWKLQILTAYRKLFCTAHRGGRVPGLNLFTRVSRVNWSTSTSLPCFPCRFTGWSNSSSDPLGPRCRLRAWRRPLSSFQCKRAVDLAFCYVDMTLKRL